MKKHPKMNENLLNPFEIGFLIACLRAHKHRDGMEKDLQDRIQERLLTMAKYYGTQE